jgi:single-strand DNA-binding protein
MNNITVHGRLTADPIKRSTQTGKDVVNFSIADNYRNGVNFWDCEAWESTARTIEQYCKKGTNLVMVGDIQTDTWEKDGQKYSKKKFVVRSFTFSESAGSVKQDDSQKVDTQADLPEIDVDDMPF